MNGTMLRDIAVKARENAYAPYSGFKVGAALLGSSGKVYTGCNIENSSYGLTICAERVAVVKAVSEGEREFTALALAGSGAGFIYPCGACLQVLAEFAPRLKIEIVEASGDYKITSVKELLPRAFVLKQREEADGN